MSSAKSEAGLQARWADWSGLHRGRYESDFAGRRRWLIAAAVLVILGVAGGLAANRQTQFRTLYHHVTGADPTDEGYISPYRATHLKEWLKDYDPAEIDYLKATGTFSPTLELEVVTLEFRQACRETARAESAAQAASSTDRASIVDGIMIPEIARLKDRNSARDESAKMFSDLAEKLKAGDYASVTDWLSGPSGACTDAISYGH